VVFSRLSPFSPAEYPSAPYFLIFSEINKIIIFIKNKYILKNLNI